MTAKVIVGMRPEHLPAAGNRRTGPPLAGEVDLVEALGSELEVHFNLDAVRAVAEGAPTEDAEAAVINGEDVAGSPPDTGQGRRQDHLCRPGRGHAVLRPGFGGGHLELADGHDSGGQPVVARRGALPICSEHSVIGMPGMRNGENMLVRAVGE
jgi:TOBE domain